MKNATQVIALLTLIIITFKSYSAPYFVGEVSAKQVLTDFPKFISHKEDVSYTAQQLAKFEGISDQIDITIFFGQWCHDSQREVPRLIKLLQQLDKSNFSLTMYALDIEKSDPEGRAKANKIKRTPTIIINKNGEEVGRILEFPNLDWATDISGLLKN